MTNTVLYASVAGVVWGIVLLKGGSITKLAMRWALWNRACMVYLQATFDALKLDHGDRWRWAKSRAKQEMGGMGG